MKSLEYWSPEETEKRETRWKRLAAWDDYQNWQAAVTMNLIFGDNYVEVPPIPDGYDACAKRWWDNEKSIMIHRKMI